jgi:hypothetical protein
MYFLVKLISLVLLTLLSVFNSFAQEYSYSHYDTKDGLAGSTVHGIAQTKDGFLWFGTETGLSRFDGAHFKNFTMADGLPSNEVFGLFLDSKDRLWVSSFKNAVSYYAKGKIHNQENDSLLKKINLSSLYITMAECDNGDVIIQENFRTHIITTNNDIKTLNVGVFNGAGSFRYPLNIVSVYGPLTTNLVNLPVEIRRKSKSLPYAGTVLCGDTMTYAFNDNGMIKLINFKTSLSLSVCSILQILDKHELTICSPVNGARIFDLTNGLTSCKYFDDYIVHFVFKDMEHNLWFSTKGSGIFKISPNRFKNLFSVNEKGTTYIRDIHKMGSYIYVGGFNNKYWRLDAVNDSFFKHNITNKPILFIPDRTFLKNIPNQTFISTGSSDFLNLRSIKNDTINSSKTILSYGDTLLIANHMGVFLFSKSKAKILSNLYLGRSTCAYKQGPNYYIGTFNGLYEITPTAKIRFMGSRFVEFKSEITSFAESTDGILWISSNGSGVFGYKNGKIIATFNQKNGLNSNLCRSLCISGNKLWVGTEKGLNKIDITQGRYKVKASITTNDGLNSNIVNTICNDGNFVYVGTPIGVTVFDERNISEHGISYINMTDVTVSGRALDPGINNITLKHIDNNISFEYAGISFLSEGDITYKYRIMGLDDKWKTTSESVLTFPSLPSGDYTLELVAINKFRDESKVLQFHFSIERSIPETIWFRAGVFFIGLVIIVMIIYYGIRSYHRKEANKLKLDHKIISLEQMALRAQMNPHFIFNCLNSMQQYILDGDIRRANFYLSRFAGLVRETLENASKIYIPIEDELSYLINYIDLERLQLSETFDYIIDVDRAIDQKKMMIPNMVLQPYIENAIQHALGKMPFNGLLKIQINLLQSQQLLECIIEDNGPGIGHLTNHLPTPKRSPKGMSITDKRIQTLNQLNPHKSPIALIIQDISDTDINANGTRIILHFPI